MLNIPHNNNAIDGANNPTNTFLNRNTKGKSTKNSKCSLAGTYHLNPHSDILSGVVRALLF